MNNLRKEMGKPFAQRPTVKGLEFKPSPISFKKLSVKLPLIDYYCHPREQPRGGKTKLPENNGT